MSAVWKSATFIVVLHILTASAVCIGKGNFVDVIILQD